MARSSRQEDYLRFRAKFPFFSFEKQEYDLTAQGLDIRFTFSLAGQYFFYPTVFIPRKSFFLPDDLLHDSLDSIIFNIGMIEMISYWKAACPVRVIVKPFSLHPDQVAWWKKQYYYGLGEFFYLNGITAAEDDFMVIEAGEGAHELAFEPDEVYTKKIPLTDSLIIPIGGGKDSAVTLELLGALPGSLPLIMNPRGASLETIVAKGFDADHFLEIRRRIDPTLLELNEMGFLNGHTPFSAMLAFETVLAAFVSGRRHIALSNESSANEATIEGTTVNHQYSKTFQFESDFREYVRRWISKEINYFSFLRPLDELQIASLFSQFPRYHKVFKSCNAGSKTDSWCCRCAKCLFTWCILSPFVAEQELVEIFGKNLLEDASLTLILDQLTGVADEKPFDCVGTIREVNLALCETIRKYPERRMPFLLEHYRASGLFDQYGDVDFAGALATISDHHFVPPGFFTVLRQRLQG